MRSPRYAISSLLIVCAVVAVGATQRGAQQRRPARMPTLRSGIAVFEDADFGGRTRTFTVDVDDLRSSGFNDRISSVVVARGETWELCVDPDYRGRCTTVTDSEPNLNDIGWNDKISSMHRIRGREGAFGRTQIEQTLELFAGTNYSGQRYVINGPVKNLRSSGFNDRALSGRVRGGGSWELCLNADYDDCRVINGDVPNLNRIGLTRAISSVRPRAGRR
jgi:hypothetical protein